MALPPSSVGERIHTVHVESVSDELWRATVDGHVLPPIFTSEGGARDAAMAEVIRLEAVAHALLRRIRATSRRKQP